MKLTIKKKLLFSFGLVLLLMIIIGAASFYMLNQVQKSNEEVVDMMDEVNFTVQAELDHYVWLNELGDTFINEDEFEGELDHTQCNFGEWYYDTLESEEFQNFNSEFRETFRQLEEPHQKLHASAQEINEIRNDDTISQEERNERAEEIYNEETKQYIQEVSALLTDIRDNIEGESNMVVEESARQSSLARTAIMAISIVAIIVSIILALVLNSRITTPINNVVASLRNLNEEEGDLTTRLEVNTNDEVKDLVDGFNRFISKLHDIINQVHNSAVNVAHASREISEGNQDLSQRTQEQASSLEEFSATIEEITSSMESSGANAREANNISSRTMESVREGEEVVENMQEAMDEITESSQEIAEIIDQVNDIAFQTNLLALNAAVEAARAGEAGQGFAVVASEVRNLAGRAAESAEDIEKLINNSIEKIESGNDLMTRTEEVLQEIVENTKKTSDVVGEIAASLKEQNVAAEEINNSVEELNEVTQQNASLVEEIASSSESMESDAQTLSELVNQFTLADDKEEISEQTEEFEQEEVEETVEEDQHIEQENFNEDDFEKF
ncbi:MAG: methyl-accepting chemotaxis protein [Halanaerobiales bacterium]